MQQLLHRAEQLGAAQTGLAGRTGGGGRPGRQKWRQALAQRLVQGQGRSLDHGMQQPSQSGVRHQRIPRPPRAEQEAGRFGRQALQQPRFAHAGFARHQHHMGGLPALAQGLQLGLAADQPWRAQHRDRHRRGPGGRACGWRRSHAGLYGAKQGQRFGARRRTHLMLEQLFAAVKGQHRSGPVATQVVQAHDPAVGVFRQGFGLEQRQRQRQCGGGVAGGFERFDARLGLVARRGLALGALARQPGLNFVQACGVERAQQGRRIGQIVGDARGQRQRGGASHQLAPAQLAQPEQALAQRVARRCGAALRPQQGGQVFARGGAFKRQPGQQQGIEKVQLDRKAIAAKPTRRAGKAKPLAGREWGGVSHATGYRCST